MGGNGATVLVGGVRGVLLLSKELGISGFLRLLPKEWGGGTEWGGDGLTFGRWDDCAGKLLTFGRWDEYGGLECVAGEGWLDG